MNNKGFTLVELLATIIILAIITGISVSGYLSYLESARKKTEELFKSTISDHISAFIDDNTTKLSNGSLAGDNIYKLKYNGNEEITFQTLINASIMDETELVNGTNEKQCNVGTEITIYRDMNYVYCYKIDNLDCLEYTDDKSINTCSSYMEAKLNSSS